MKKTYILLSFLCASFVLVAQNASDLNLDEIEVYANKVDVVSSARNTITTLTAEQINAIPASSINELLNLIPGIDIRTRGANGAQADISMRGGTNDQVLVLLNGVNITDPRTGHANLDLPISKSSIVRIEILQGTALEQFGLNAFAGAINIVTNENYDANYYSGLNHKIALEGGDNGYFAPSYSLRSNSEKINWVASADYNRSTGFMHNTDYSYGNLFTSGQVKSQSGLWQWQAGGQIKKFGSNGFYALSYPDQYEATQTAFASAKWNKTFKRWNLESSLYYRLHHDTWYLYRPNSENYPNGYEPNRHITQLSGLNVKSNVYFPIGHLSMGLELRNENILSSVLGEQRQLDSNDPTHYKYSKNRLNINYFVQQTFVWADNWTAQLGVAGNYNTMFANNFAFSAQMSYQYAEQSTVYVGANRTLRLPTFTDLYYQSVTQTANPNLLPETSYNFELGTKYLKTFDNRWQLNAAASVYYRIGMNIIDWIKLPQDAKWQSANHTRVDAAGGEAIVGLNRDKWIITASYAFTNLTQSMENAFQGYISKYALDYLRHKATLQFGHPIWKGFGALWTYCWQQRSGNYIDINGLTQTYKPVNLLDGRIYWKNPKIEVYVEGSNLLNLSYYDYGGIAQPGRWLKAGVQLNL